MRLLSKAAAIGTAVLVVLDAYEKIEAKIKKRKERGK